MTKDLFPTHWISTEHEQATPDTGPFIIATQDSSSATRRQLLISGSALMTGLLATSASNAQTNGFLAARIWPSESYTRITLEHPTPLKFSQFLLDNPKRLVIDLENVSINELLKAINDKINPNDPYIQQIRVAPNRPNVTRLVIELKQAIRHEIFLLKPMISYQYRLVIDLHNPNKSIHTPQITANSLETSDSTQPSTIDDTQALPEPTPLKQTGRQYTNRLKRKITIALDPGHGGEDPGAIGPSGLYEKNVVLQIAKKIREKLLQLPNIQVMMTRDADFFVPLNVRVQKARRAKADLFMSIHADAFIRPEANGTSVFALSERGASSSAARWLANDQNKADLIGGMNVAGKDAHIAKVLMDMSMSAQIRDSLRLGSSLLKYLGDVNRLHSRHVEQASFAVLKAPDIPSVLVETAFISNPSEEARLRQDDYQHKMAQAIVDGIKRYIASNPSFSRKPI